MRLRAYMILRFVTHWCTFIPVVFTKRLPKAWRERQAWAHSASIERSPERFWEM